MSQPVKLSDELVLDARLSGAAMQRSIAGQVERWARLGRKVELALNGAQAAPEPVSRPATVAESLATMGTPEGRRRLNSYLQSLPFPHYQAHPTEKGKLVRTEQDGTRSTGRFINRQFEVDNVASLRKPAKSVAKKSSEMKAGALR